MLFSVVIPTYDRRDLLQRALQSVTAQRFADFELIVVDDGSTDDTVEFLRAQHPQVHVVQQANRGPGAARNAGAKKAKGNYLAFLDSDDVWFPWTLDVAATVIARHRASIVSGSIRPFRDERELDDVRDGETVAEGFVDYLSSSQKGYFVGAGVAFVDRAAFLASGGFNEHLLHSEDHDLFLRM